MLASELKPSARLVGLAMAVYADRDGGSIYPGNAALAKGTGHNEKTVRRALLELRETGFVRLHRRGNRRAGRADEWRLTLPGLEGTMTTDRTRSVDIDGSISGQHAHPTEPLQQTSTNKPVQTGTGEGLSEEEIEANMASAPSFDAEPEPLPTVHDGAPSSVPDPPARAGFGLESDPFRSSPVRTPHPKEATYARNAFQRDAREQGFDPITGEQIKRKAPKNRRPR